ncbi:MAG: class I SAM-dependent RNA methyltransferase [Oligoflexia bacterium]|nr:class I SAM-dependent RNA methyltransferase [Oligoflexia bacterium]
MNDVVTCGYFPGCGGCDLLGMTYRETLKLKLDKFKKTILSYRDLFKTEQIENLKIIASPLQTGYRSRCQLHVINGKIGFFSKSKSCSVQNNLKPEFVEIQECKMLMPELNKKITDMKFPLNYNAKIELYLNNNTVCERIVEKKFDNYFTQINPSVNQILINEVINFIKPQQNDNILDLYCGSGNFTVPLSQKAGICGIDSKIHAVSSGRIEYIEADINAGLKILERSGRLRSFSKLLIDPPRSGINKKTMQKLGDMDFNTVVYVSCNPDSLLRDIAGFKNSGYLLSGIILFDMFPFTRHIESLSLLKKIR